MTARHFELSGFRRELRVTAWVIGLVQNHCSFFQGRDPKTT